MLKPFCAAPLVSNWTTKRSTWPCYNQIRDRQQLRDDKFPAVRCYALRSTPSTSIDRLPYSSPGQEENENAGLEGPLLHEMMYKKCQATPHSQWVLNNSDAG